MFLNNTGIILTIIFGIITIIGIFVSFLVINRPKLKYYQIDPIKLFSNKVEELSKFRIYYKNKKVNEKIVFLQALIINEGNCDIDLNSIYEPLCIRFKSPYKLLDAYIDDIYKNILLEINNNDILLKWDLLKKKEYFIINIILQCENDEDDKNFSDWNLRNNYTVLTSRIKNIYKIKKESYNKIISNRSRIKIIVNVSIMLLTFIVLIFSSIHVKQIERAMEINNHKIQNIANVALDINYIYLKIVTKYENIMNSILNEEIDINNINNEITNIGIQKNEISDLYQKVNKDENVIDSEYSIEKYILIDSYVLLLIFISIILLLLNIYFIISYIKNKILFKYIE